jgi:hypothetical protein
MFLPAYPEESLVEQPAIREAFQLTPDVEPDSSHT